MITFKTGAEATWQPKLNEEHSLPLGFFKYRDDNGVSDWYKALGTMFYMADAELIESIGGHGIVGSWTAEKIGAVKTENGWFEIKAIITYCNPGFSDSDPSTRVRFTTKPLPRKPKKLKLITKDDK